MTATIPPDLASALPERYELHTVLGRGGMGPILGVLVGAMGAPGEVIAVVVPAWFGLTAVTARTSYRLTVRSRGRTLAGLADRLAEMTKELVGERRPIESPRGAF